MKKGQGNWWCFSAITILGEENDVCFEISFVTFLGT